MGALVWAEGTLLEAEISWGRFPCATLARTQVGGAEAAALATWQHLQDMEMGVAVCRSGHPGAAGASCSDGGGARVSRSHVDGLATMLERRLDPGSVLGALGCRADLA